jgi:hypothetical protein
VCGACVPPLYRRRRVLLTRFSMVTACTAEVALIPSRTANAHSVGPDPSVGVSILNRLVAECADTPLPESGAMEAPGFMEVNEHTVAALLAIMDAGLARWARGRDAAQLQPFAVAVALFAITLRQLKASGVDPELLNVKFSDSLVPLLLVERDASWRASNIQEPAVSAIEAVVQLLFAVCMLPSMPAANAEAVAALLADFFDLLLRAAQAAVVAGVISMHQLHSTTPFPDGSARLRLVNVALTAIAADGASASSDSSPQFLRVPAADVTAQAFMESTERRSLLQQFDILLPVAPGTRARRCALFLRTAPHGRTAILTLLVFVSTPRVCVRACVCLYGSGSTPLAVCMPLMRRFMFRLVSVVADAMKPPAKESTLVIESLGATVCLTDLLHRVMLVAKNLFSAKPAAAFALADVQGLWNGAGGMLLLEGLTAVSCLWRCRGIAEALLPPLLQMLPSLRRLAVAVCVTGIGLPHADTMDVETVLRLEQTMSSMFGVGGSPATSFPSDMVSGRWLLHTLATASWLAGRQAAALVSGPPMTADEMALLPWLASPLLSSGVDNDAVLASGGVTGSATPAAGSGAAHSHVSAKDLSTMYSALRPSNWSPLFKDVLSCEGMYRRVMFVA